MLSYTIHLTEEIPLLLFTIKYSYMGRLTSRLAGLFHNKYRHAVYSQWVHAASLRKMVNSCNLITSCMQVLEQVKISYIK